MSAFMLRRHLMDSLWTEFNVVDKVHLISKEFCKMAPQQKIHELRNDYLPLDPKVKEAVEPIYKDLSRRELLDRCKGNNTQNNNESYNGLLWHFASKHLHSDLKTIELSNYLAVGIFNNGFSSILKMLSIMGVIIGRAASDYAADRDEMRLRVAEHHHRAASRESQSARRRASTAQQVLFEEDDGELYGPGIAD